MRSGAGVELLVNLSQALVIHMSVNLGGCDVGMTEEFLDDAEIRPVLEEVRGEGVAKEVRIDVLLNARLPSAFLDDFPDTVGAERSTTHREEDFRGGVRLDELRSLVGEVGF